MDIITHWHVEVTATLYLTMKNWKQSMASHTLYNGDMLCNLSQESKIMKMHMTKNYPWIPNFLYQEKLIF